MDKDDIVATGTLDFGDLTDMPAMSTREKIEHWMKVFECQWNDVPVMLTVSQRELLGKLLLEECLESLVKGLGLLVFVSVTPTSMETEVRLNEGQPYNPIEFADGLADTAWVAYYNARVAGFNLDDVIDEVYESNMSKLDADGRPIHNMCRHDAIPGANPSGVECLEDSHLIDPTKPRGKILKGPNFRTPDIAKAIGV